ncbi:MAG: SDR family oxidoreductase [Proteobacteria bacterium]|nr:SDR family oxidoreductase [Pseudomonadota bacterium]
MKIEPGMKVFITGAASGIGRATAIAMGRRGSRLFLTDRNEAGLKETVKFISPPGEVSRFKSFDISSYEAVKAFADEIHAEFGPMDIIVNNAGIALYALVEDMTHAHWQKVINVNLWGPIHGIECFLPEMIRAKKGHVVTVSSASGLIGAPLHAAYASAKFGLVGLSEVLRYDLMMHNIGVTVICPGAVDTPLKNTVEILGADPKDPRVKELKEKFSRHAVPPEKVAGLIVRAVEKNRFLVITSFDIKLVYFLKRCFFPLYHFIMIRITNLLTGIKK